MTALHWLDPEQPGFPDTHLALDEPNGLLAVGGALNLEWLELAYRQGIFPWFSDNEPILWWSPSPRMVLFPSKLRINRSLRRTIRQSTFDRITFDQAFSVVIDRCAGARKGKPGTWITESMKQAYRNANVAGLAHSIEVWSGNQLVGGLYGILIGTVFFGESMFSGVSGGSRIALIALVRAIPELSMIDCQMYTEHLARMGAIEIERDDFESRLKVGVSQPKPVIPQELTPEKII